MTWALSNSEAVAAVVAVLADPRGVRSSTLGRVYRALVRGGGDFSLTDGLRVGLLTAAASGLTRDEVVAVWRAAFPEARAVGWKWRGGEELLHYETRG